MSLSTSFRLGSVVAVALAAQTAFAGPPGHAGGAHMGGAHVGGAHVGGAHVGGVHPGGVHYAPAGASHHTAPYYRSVPYYSGYRGVGIGVGLGYGYGYGSGLYGPLGYGLGYSPFGYSGLGYGGLGYGALGYGYGYPSTRALAVGLPATTSYSVPYQYIAPQSSVDTGEPLPLPLPAPGNGNGGKGEPATITVITSDGATVMFDDLASEQAGTRHSFTTKPIAPGVQSRVLVKVNGPGGASSVSIGVRSGEKATVDMRN